MANDRNVLVETLNAALPRFGQVKYTALPQGKLGHPDTSDGPVLIVGPTMPYGCEFLLYGDAGADLDALSREVRQAIPGQITYSSALLEMRLFIKFEHENPGLQSGDEVKIS